MSVEALARVPVARPLPMEEQGRADLYALLGRLLAGAPDERLLAAIAAAGGVAADGDPTLSKA